MGTQRATNVASQAHHVRRNKRGKAGGTRGAVHACTVWLPGLCGAGRTTVNMAVEEYLAGLCIPCCTVDGDNTHQGFSKVLPLVLKDREGNARCAPEVGELQMLAYCASPVFYSLVLKGATMQGKFMKVYFFGRGGHLFMPLCVVITQKCQRILHKRTELGRLKVSLE